MEVLEDNPKILMSKIYIYTIITIIITNSMKKQTFGNEAWKRKQPPFHIPSSGATKNSISVIIFLSGNFRQADE